MQYTNCHIQGEYLHGSFSKLSFFFYIFTCVFGHFAFYNQEINYNILKDHA